MNIRERSDKVLGQVCYIKKMGVIFQETVPLRLILRLIECRRIKILKKSLLVYMTTYVDKEKA